MTSRDTDAETVPDETGRPEPIPNRPFQTAMIIVIGFGVATALTGLLTMGLIEFAQSIGWWDGSGR